MSAPMTITYYNSAGASLVLNSGNYFVSVNDLRNFTWDYVATNRPSGYGGRVTFKRPVQEKSITISIKGTTAEEFNTNAAALMALTEVDILNAAPGKLYLGAQYINCYLSVSSVVDYYSRRGNWVTKTLKIIMTEPFWSLETTQRFIAGDEETYDNAKRYLGKYPMRYIANFSNVTLFNDHYAPAPMIITIYGAVSSPTISIAGNTYAIAANLGAAERAEVNQIDRTIYKITSTGTRLSLFDYRDKDHDIFQYAPAGNSVIIFAGFNFDITLVQQRSEPTWI